MLLLLAAPALASGAPVIYYTDLAVGPNTGGESNLGAFVTVFGRGFGMTRGNGSVTIGGGQAGSYRSWADTKIVIQLGPQAMSGNISVTDAAAATSNGVPFTVGAGRVREATTATMASVVSSVQSGDVIYMRGGTYSSRYGTTTWGDRALVLGPWAANVAFVGYPGESVTIGAVNLADQGGVANGVTLANFSIRSSFDCIYGGHFWQNEESGATNTRAINLDCQANYGSANTMTGLIALGGDGWRVLGSYFHDTGSVAVNNNHAIYIQVGADDVEVAWNRFERIKLGHVIQTHTDGTARTYENIRVHDNEISATSPDDCRGINFGNVSSSSYGVVYNNVLRNVGQDFSAIAVYAGTWKIFNNTLVGIKASPGIVWVQGSGGHAEVRNNVIVSNGQSPYITAFNGGSMSQFTISNNLYFGNGGAPSQDTAPVNSDPLFVDLAIGNLRLGLSSPAVDTGTNAVQTVVLLDHDGNSRPQRGGFDIGAYEATGVSLPRVQNVRIQVN